MIVLGYARGYAAQGYSLIPIIPDGSKSPACESWKRYQAKHATEAQVTAWFKSGRKGIALIHGAVSGGSEVLDFDAPGAFGAFKTLVPKSLLDRLVHVTTPSGGSHLYYRCPDAVERNQKLARDGHGRVKIETRGEGGYTLAPGSPAACHEANQPYSRYYGSFAAVPVLTPDERAVLLDAARSLDESPKLEARQIIGQGGTAGAEGKPGFDYNASATTTDVLALLLSSGWNYDGERSGDVYDLTRPGKADGLSATLGFCRGDNDCPLFYVFSSNAAPFDSGRAYTPFAVYAYLKHGGDFAEAARDLGKTGYGAALAPTVEMSIDKYTVPSPKNTIPLPSGDPYSEQNSVFSSEPPAPSVHKNKKPGSDVELTARCAAFALTDLGNAERLIARHGADLRYSTAYGWLVWDGARWEPDTPRKSMEWAKHTIRAIREEAAFKAQQAAKETDETRRGTLDGAAKALFAWAIKSESNRSLTSALQLAETEPGVYVPTEDLDTDPFLLTVGNGTLNLLTGCLRPSERADLCTKRVATPYLPDALCPIWLAFLERILPGFHLRAYLQRIAGYALTGSVREQELYFLFGSGANGKSTLIDTLLALMCDFGRQASSELLTAKRSDMVRDDVANLAGKRLVATIETEEGRAMAESLLKQLTGGDRITARLLYKNSFEFSPTFKILFAANHKPVMKNNDHGVWRRIRLIPFSETITDEEKDRDLPAKLRAELPGILAWCVAGCMDWQTGGMRTPEEVLATTQEYRDDSDLIGRFLAEACYVGDNAQVKASLLYETYCKWCEGSGERPRTGTAFGRAISERNGIEKHRSGTGIVYTGLGVIDTRNETNDTNSSDDAERNVYSVGSDPAFRDFSHSKILQGEVSKTLIDPTLYIKTLHKEDKKEEKEEVGLGSFFEGEV